jgi:general secretion pathway protein H
MRLPISPTNSRRAGFTLIELSMAMLILALIAAIALPRILPGSSASALRFSAWEVAAMLRADRNAAIGDRRAVDTRFDLAGHRITSGASGRMIRLPGEVSLRLDSRIDGRIRFTPDGRSSGGLFVLARGSAGYGVRINGFTGVVEIVAVKP